MKIGAVILSRYNSSRLYGKALMKIAGKSVLQIIIERLLVVLDLQCIVIATSVEVSDDPIVEFAESNSIQYYRGSLTNVAERFFEASSFYGFDYSIRINGDNVFVDIDLLGQMIVSAKSEKFDFLSNVKNRTYPKGMSIEILRVSFYGALLEFIGREKHFVEHVTLYLYENEDRINHLYFYNTTIKEAEGIQLALDTPDDFQLINRVFNRFDCEHVNYKLGDIIKIYKEVYDEENF